MTNQTELSDDVEIFKYIPEAHIRSLLEQNNLYFSRVNRWPDIMEQFLDKQISPEQASKRYGSCWTLHKGIISSVADEDDGKKAMDSVKQNGLESMWKTYCPRGGVRIRTTLGKVRATLNNYQNATEIETQEGSVIYKSYKSIKGRQAQDQFFWKSPCFYTDDEYRFLITAKDGEADHLDIPIANIAHFVDEILVSPPTPENTCDHSVSNQIFDYLSRIDNQQFSWAELQDGKLLHKRKSCLYGGW